MTFNSFIQSILPKQAPLPVNDMNNSKQKSLHKLFTQLWLVLALVSLVMMTIGSQHAGISGDEFRYINQAEKVYQYYHTWGADKSAVEQKGIDPQHYNAQSFDNTLYTLQKWIGLPPNSFDFRHFCNTVTGWLGILFASLIAYYIGGPRMALLTFLLLLLSPRFLGHSYNNHRDIPMASAVCFTVFFMIHYLKKLPRFQWNHFMWVVIGIAWSYSLRLGGGVLVMGYLLFFTGLAYLTRLTGFPQIVSELKTGTRMLLVSLAACAGGFAIGVLTWPFALEAPIQHSLEVLNASSSLGVSLRQIFEGEALWSDKMPWYYTLKYMSITIPAFVILCFVAFPAFIKKIVNKANILPFLMVVAAVLLPLFYATFIVKNHYGGWRHFLFVYPFIVILAAFSLEGLFRLIKPAMYRHLFWLVLALGMIHPVRYIIKNHPYEYTYFNELIGGIEGAQGQYETDYSLNSLRGASEWMIDSILPDIDTNSPIIVGTNDSRTVRHYFKDHTNKVRVSYLRYYERGNHDWDYAIFYNSLIAPVQLRNGHWPPSNVVYEERADKVPLSIVLKREHKLDYQGHEAMKKNNAGMATAYLEQALKIDPANESVLVNLSQLYTQTGQHKRAIETAYAGLKVYPDYDRLLNILGIAFLHDKQLDNALGTFNHLTQVNYKYYTAYYNMGLIFMRKEQPYEAIHYLEKCLEQNGGYAQAYFLMADALNQTGQKELAEQYLQAGKSLQ